MMAAPEQREAGQPQPSSGDATDITIQFDREGGADVLAFELASFQPGLLSIYLKPQEPASRLFVHWTADGWATQQATDGELVDSTFKVCLPVDVPPGKTQDVTYAVCLVTDKENWLNNGGANYTVSVTAPLTKRKSFTTLI